MINRILITTECVADLPQSLLKNSSGDIIYFDIETDKGLFRDTVEINSRNVMEYMADGEHKAHSIAPSANDFKKFFARNLKEYDEIIHICISSKSSESYANASLARAKMGADGNKIHIIDSLSLSGGQCLIVMEAIRLRDIGLSSKEVVNMIDEYKKRVVTTFLAYSADYLYYNGKVSKNVMKICQFFRLHPVLAVEDGKMVLKKIYIGNYNKAAKKYIKSTLKRSGEINKDNAFIVYSGCDYEMTKMIKENVDKRINFTNLYEQQASATISSNCGPKTFGVLYVKEN